MMLKRQRKPEKHVHYVITCGNVRCQMMFPICGAAGMPCFVICCYCSTTNQLGGVSHA